MKKERSKTKALELKRETVRTFRVTSEIRTGGMTTYCRGGVGGRSAGCPLTCLCTTQV